MAALGDAEASAAEQDQDGRGDADTRRKVAFEERDQSMRRFALKRRLGGLVPRAQPLAQKPDRADGGGFQVSLGPQRSQRSSEASFTIHCTSSSNVGPGNACGIWDRLWPRPAGLVWGAREGWPAV